MNGFSRLAFCLPAMVLSFASCGTNEIFVNGGNYVEPVSETIVFTNAELVYNGDDGYTEISDAWTLKLYTDMPVDESGNPVGAGQLMQISVNAALNAEQTPDPSLLTGSYREQSSTGDFAVGTFNSGYLVTLDMPNGTLELPDGSFFGDIPEGSTEYTPDLLRDGTLKIEYKSDGTLAVSGILVGTEFVKRRFSFRGAVEIVDRSEVQIPNSTLTEDVVDLSTLTQTRLRDRGDSFMLGTESYRLFEIMLAEPSVDLTSIYPAGSGQVLRLELYVGWDAVADEGIPAGEYIAAKRVSGGIDKSDIVPFRVVAGEPDNFNTPSGSWYQTLADGLWGERYARIADGTVKVERPDGGHRLIIDLLDCNDPAHRICGTWESAAPIHVFK